MQPKSARVHFPFKLCRIICLNLTIPLLLCNIFLVADCDVLRVGQNLGDSSIGRIEQFVLSLDLLVYTGLSISVPTALVLYSCILEGTLESQRKYSLLGHQPASLIQQNIHARLLLRGVSYPRFRLAAMFSVFSHIGLEWIVSAFLDMLKRSKILYFHRKAVI